MSRRNGFGFIYQNIIGVDLNLCICNCSTANKNLDKENACLSFSSQQVYFSFSINTIQIRTIKMTKEKEKMAFHEINRIRILNHSTAKIGF